MLRLFVQILGRRLRGQVVRRLRLLRNPRYLVGTLVGLAYFAWLFLQPYADADADDPPMAGVARLPEILDSLDLRLVVEMGGALALAVLVTVTWILQRGEPRVYLSEPELHLLLPAPVSRRGVLVYSLAKTQLGLLFSVLILAALAVRRPADLVVLPSAWLLLELADLHLRTASFWKARTDELDAVAPRRARLRRWALPVLFGGFWALVLGSLGRTFGPLIRAAREGALPEGELAERAAALLEAWAGSLAGLLLTPLRWLVRPAIEGTGTPGAVWLGLVALVVAHVVYLLRSPVRFEESALSHARHTRDRTPGGRGRRRRTRLGTSSRRRAPFPLAPTGRPEVAIPWKNLLHYGRWPLSRVAAVLAGLVAGFALLVVVLGQPVPLLVTGGVVGLFLAAFLPFLAGLVLRQDLRQDLLAIEAFRAWPLPGSSLVLAEIAAPVAAATAFAGVGLGIATISVLSAAGAAGTHGLAAHGPAVVASALAILPVAAAVAAASSLLQNLAALALPSWIPLGPQSRESGPAAMGQNILIFLVHGLGMTILLLGPALAVAVVLGTQALADLPIVPWEIPPLALLATAVLALELVPLVLLAGRLWDRLDPSAELLGSG